VTDARHVVNVRGWPGLDDYRPPSAPVAHTERLGDPMALVVVAAAKAGCVPEEFGLGAFLVVVGSSVIQAGLVAPDDLPRNYPVSATALRAWATSHLVVTTTGPRPWIVRTLSEFYDPLTGEFVRRAYSGGDFCVGADLGRVFGLAAAHCGSRTGEYADEWELWLPGWGRAHPGGRWKRRSPHRPSLRVSARRVGWQVEFGPCGTDAEGRLAGKRVRGRMWCGRFVDSLSLAYALDGDRSASFAEHCANFGLPAQELPVAVTVDEAGAECIAQAAHAVHTLTVVLDARAGQWFTTVRDRSEGRARIDLSRTSSPGALAAHIPERLRLGAPLAIFDLRPDEHRAWAEAFHGGWCDADRRLIGVPFPTVAADVSSCFPLVSHLLGWWELLCAERVERRDVTKGLRRLCQLAVERPESILDPATFARLGFTVVEVWPDGEPWPIEVEDERRPDGRMEVVPVFSPRRTFRFASPDVLAVAVRRRRVPRSVRATQLVPVGRQARIRRRLPMLPGRVLDTEQDPAMALVEYRRRVKADGDSVLAAELRVVANSLVFGIPARFDEVRRREGRRRIVGERPGPRTFLPVPASVAAGARLLLAVLDRMVSDLGGLVAYRDTDSSLIPALPDGGDVTLADGSIHRALSWPEVDTVLGAFDGLSGNPASPVWNTERGTPEAPLHALVYGPKRHVEFTSSGDRPSIMRRRRQIDTSEGAIAEVVARTEAQLGGTFVDPPMMSGRSADGGRRWSLAAVEREIAHTRKLLSQPDALRSPAPWDSVGSVAFPALQRFMVKTPEMARSLPACLGPRPGTRYVTGVLDITQRDLRGAPVALDPGGDLADWPNLRWVDRVTGRPVRVTTDHLDLDGVVLDTLASRAARWSRPSPAAQIEAVTVDPLLVRSVGRVSGVIDADLDGLPGDLGERRPVYEDAQRAAAIGARAQSMGPRRFARLSGLPLKVAERAALGKPISARNVARALRALSVDSSGPRRCPVDGRAVFGRSDTVYCSARCKDRAYRQRRRTRSDPSLTQTSGNPLDPNRKAPQ
jgi:hypothetical protein